MVVDGEAQTARPLRRCLAAWLGILLALAPFARPSLPVDLTPARAASGFWLVAHDDGMAQARETAPRVQPAQPLALGMLARWSWFETKLGPAPTKPPLGRLSASDHPQDNRRARRGYQRSLPSQLRRHRTPADRPTALTTSVRVSG